MKLNDIDPDTLARTCCESWYRTTARRADELGLTLTGTLSAECPAWRAIVALTRYAQTGERLPEGRTVRDMADEVRATLPVLYDVVMPAARAREGLERGEPVGTSELAALGSVLPGSVRAAITRGQIVKIGRDEVDPRSAVDWLAPRGIANLPTPAANTPRED